MIIFCILDEERPKDPCNPSPCGPNSQCRAANGVGVCSCLAGYMGAPPACRPECVLSNECSPTQACVNNKCTDPCVGSCGLNARCQVINHSPICSCPPGNTGDPFRSCYPIPSMWCFIINGSLHNPPPPRRPKSFLSYQWDHLWTLFLQIMSKRSIYQSKCTYFKYLIEHLESFHLLVWNYT